MVGDCYCEEMVTFKVRIAQPPAHPLQNCLRCDRKRQAAAGITWIRLQLIVSRNCGVNVVVVVVVEVEARSGGRLTCAVIVIVCGDGGD